LQRSRVERNSKRRDQKSKDRESSPKERLNRGGKPKRERVTHLIKMSKGERIIEA
jgi:hypothetical protein